MKGSGYEGYDITTVRVYLRSTSAVSAVLHIYAAPYTDDTAASGGTRFAGMTAAATSPAVTVDTGGSSSTIAFDFDFTGTTLTGTDYSFFIREASGGSLWPASVSFNYVGSTTTGGAGGHWGPLKHEVFGVPA